MLGQKSHLSAFFFFPDPACVDVVAVADTVHVLLVVSLNDDPGGVIGQYVAVPNTVVNKSVFKANIYTVSFVCPTCLASPRSTFPPLLLTSRMQRGGCRVRSAARTRRWTQSRDRAPTRLGPSEDG
jgi:hypothetical protein